MNDSLATYLNDHMAGANFAIHLLQRMNEGTVRSTGHSFVEPLLAAIEEDRATLQGLMDELAVSPAVLKDVASWFGEKAHRMKLAASNAEDFSEFEALEFLSIGVCGKENLWNALQAAAFMDARLRKLDCDRLIERARAQRSQIEARRLNLAASVFAPSTS